MAFETGTATNRADLLAKIVTFLTTNAALVAAGQEWEDLGAASGQTTGKWLKGPGLAGTDSIYVGLTTSDNAPADTFNLCLAGAQGFSAAAPWAAQVGKSRDQFVGAWDSAMPYWIVANGQRFVVVLKVSTTYHALYAGKILPYGTPTQYAYPLFIGGSSAANYRWSDTSIAHRTFVDPGSTTGSMNSPGDSTSAQLCLPDGAWYGFGNWYPSGGNESRPLSGHRFVWPYQAANESNGASSRQREMRDNIDGGYSLLPLILNASDPSRQVFGELDGCFCVSGFGNAAENIITIGGVDYLVVQNIFRTNRWNYWALKLA